MTLLTAQHQPLENTMSHHRTRPMPSDHEITTTADHIARTLKAWEKSPPATLLRFAALLTPKLQMSDPGADAPLQARLMFQTSEAARHHNAGRREYAMVALSEALLIAAYVIQRHRQRRLLLDVYSGTDATGLVPAWQALLDEIFAVAGTAVRLASPVGEA